MQLTNEIMIALGFTEFPTNWADDHCRIYKDQLPQTLVELKAILTGKSFNKGKKAGLRSCLEEGYGTNSQGDYQSGSATY